MSDACVFVREERTKAEDGIDWRVQDSRTRVQAPIQEQRLKQDETTTWLS